jgi:hypothetical protein
MLVIPPAGEAYLFLREDKVTRAFTETQHEVSLTVRPLLTSNFYLDDQINYMLSRFPAEF